MAVHSNVRMVVNDEEVPEIRGALYSNAFIEQGRV
jgi:hypothetical protein